MDMIDLFIWEKNINKVISNNKLGVIGTIMLNLNVLSIIGYISIILNGGIV